MYKTFFFTVNCPELDPRQNNTGRSVSTSQLNLIPHIPAARLTQYNRTNDSQNSMNKTHLLQELLTQTSEDFKFMMNVCFHAC